MPKLEVVGSSPIARSNLLSKIGNLNYHSLIFTTYKIAQEKFNVHATHTMYAVPDLRVAGGRLGGRLSIMLTSKFLPILFPLSLLLRHELDELRRLSDPI